VLTYRKKTVIITVVLRKCVGYFSSSVTISPRILTFPAWVAVLAFPVVGRCRTQFIVGIWFELVMVENPRFAVGISTLSIIVPEI